MTTTTDVAAVARGLTKASKRAIVRMSGDWTVEGENGPARRDAYSLWWGRDGKKGLILPPKVHDYTGLTANWKWCLTPLGLLVRQHIVEEGSQSG